MLSRVSPLLVLLTVSVLSCGGMVYGLEPSTAPAAAAPKAAVPEPQAPAAPAPPAAQAPKAASSNGTLPALEDGQLYHAVYLRVDGNLAGRVSVFDSQGARRPVSTTVKFVQRGQVVNTARSDEWGRFQSTGLLPGVYSVISVGKSGVGVYAVRILPYNETSSRAQSLLDVVLVPTGDSGLISRTGTGSQVPRKVQPITP